MACNELCIRYKKIQKQHQLPQIHSLVNQGKPLDNFRQTLSVCTLDSHSLKLAYCLQVNKRCLQVNLIAVNVIRLASSQNLRYHIYSLQVNGQPLTDK